MAGKSSVWTLAVCVLLAGCSSDPSLGTKSSGWDLFGKKSSKHEPALVGRLDPNKPYTEYAEEYRDRPIVAPAIGLESDAPKGRLAQMAESVVDGTKRVTQNVTSSVQRGMQKTTDLVARRPGDPADPIAVRTPSEDPDAEFYLALARVQERAGNLAGAETNYQNALNLDANHLESLLALAHLYDYQGRLAEATETYSRAITAHPQSATARNDLGICLARQNKLPQAIESLKAAVHLESQRKLYRNNLAKVLLKVNRVDEAYQQLAAVHAPAVAHYNIGYMLQEMGHGQQALAHFEQAVAADPQLVEARRWRDTLAQRSGAAVAADQRASIVPPQSPPAWQTAPASGSPVGDGAPGGQWRGPLVTPQAAPPGAPHIAPPAVTAPPTVY